jgi:hypothetical protein
MQNFWFDKYKGRSWEEKGDCFGWFKYWRKNHFNDEMASIPVDHGRLVLSATRILTGDVTGVFGWEQTDTPKEGDAVFLSQRKHPHHVGMVVFPGGRMHILHALEGIGVVLSDNLNLITNGWKNKGFWTPCK